MIQSVNVPPSAYTITSSAHCSTLQPSAAYSQTSSAHPVHTLQQPLHLQCTHYSSHYIFSAHTTAAITSSVHTAAMYSYLQPIFSAHCSHVQLSAANLQCTLQPTAAIYNHLHYSYTIQCTLQLHIWCQYHTVHLVKKGKPIPLLAYLQSSP